MVKGHLEMCVLAILLKGKNYGYEIMKELNQYHLELKGAGSIYPILTKLKNKKVVNVTREISENGKARVYYQINEKGEKFLQHEIKEWRKIQKDISTLIKDHTNTAGDTHES